MQFKIGDVVSLKSGGPYMTVTDPHNSQAQVSCTWFDGMQPAQASFPAEALEGSD